MSRTRRITGSRAPAIAQARKSIIANLRIADMSDRQSTFFEFAYESSNRPRHLALAPNAFDLVKSCLNCALAIIPALSKSFVGLLAANEQFE